MRTEYDEERTLTAYVWSHYSRFLTPIESRAGRVVFAQKKAASGNTQAAAILIEKFKLQEDTTAMAQLTEGTVAFEHRVARRILQEHASDIFINRCPRCSRIVRTPEAQQCLWCSHDWHPGATAGQ